jgi:hypothetical protein
VALGLRVAGHRAVRLPAQGVISALRNTPLLVQLLLWYLATFGLLPEGLRRWIDAEHPWATLPLGVALIPDEYDLPQTYVVDRAGELVGWLQGPRDWSAPAARAYLEELLDAEPEPRSTPALRRQ